MVATTTQSITSLINKLTTDYPAFQFKSGADFQWEPITKTVSYAVRSSDMASLLHELAHAILEHSTFKKDIKLIEIERDAWTYAKEHLAPRYDIIITDEAVEEALDTYRDWLHARSTCPDCSAAGVQTRQESYRCIACLARWRVNDGRICALRRYRIHKNASI